MAWVLVAVGSELPLEHAAASRHDPTNAHRTRTCLNERTSHQQRNARASTGYGRPSVSAFKIQTR